MNGGWVAKRLSHIHRGTIDQQRRLMLYRAGTGRLWSLIGRRVRITTNTVGTVEVFLASPVGEKV